MYSTTDELPEALRAELPERAQQLYRAAFNRVCEKQAAARAAGEEPLASEAHKAAMLAVQSEFRRDEDGQWRPAPVGERMERRRPDKHAAGRLKSSADGD